MVSASEVLTAEAEVVEAGSTSAELEAPAVSEDWDSVELAWASEDAVEDSASLVAVEDSASLVVEELAASLVVVACSVVEEATLEVVVLEITEEDVVTTPEPWQSPTSPAGTALAPLPMAMRLVPQSSLLAKWMFRLS